MSFRRFMLVRVGLVALAACLVSFVTIGGCPQVQQPTTPPADQDQVDDTPTDDDLTPPDQERPIPPPPTDDGNGDGGSTDGGGDGTTDGGDGETDGDGTDGGVDAPPISVVITAPEGADLNLLAGADAAITYEAFGGNPADGVISIELFYDLDGLGGTGDEKSLRTGLAPQGTETFTTAGLASGTYFIGLKGANAKEEAIAYATGRLVIVGEAELTLIEPSADVRVRPNTSVPVQFTIASLATTVSYKVFTDTDTEVNGNEADAFNGGGLSGTGTILTENFAAGTYHVGVTISDSAGQEKTVYLGGANPRTITIDESPALTVLSPLETAIVDEGTAVDVEAEVQDPEGSATVKFFRDGDASFNGNELFFAEAELSSTDTETLAGTLETTDLAPGTYRLGVWVSDGVGDALVKYATGAIRINGAPTIDIFEPVAEIAVYRSDEVTVRWEADDFEKNVQQISVILAADADADGEPDDPAAVATLAAGFDLGEQDYTISTTFWAPGRYLVGVEVQDDVGMIVREYATGVVNVINALPTVTFTAPLDPQTVHVQLDTVLLEWDAFDLESDIIGIMPAMVSVVLAEDQNADGVADETPTFLTDAPTVLATGFNLGHWTYSLSTRDLMVGRYLLGVKVVDDQGDVTLAYAPGLVVVENDAPTINILQPTQMDAMRLDQEVQMVFEVLDTEGNIKPQPEGVQILIAYDENGNGNPDDVDGDGESDYWPVAPDAQHGDLGPGANVYVLNTTVFETMGKLDADGNGEFLIGVRVEDSVGDESVSWVADGLSIDSVEPTIVGILPGYQEDPYKIERNDTIDITVDTDDTSPVFLTVVLDDDRDPDNNTAANSGARIVWDGEELPQGANSTTATISIEDVDDEGDPLFEPGTYFIYVSVQDAVPAPVAEYAGKEDTPEPTDEELTRIYFRGRQTGMFRIDELDNPPPDPEPGEDPEPARGFVLQGFNFNDLAGNALCAVPDMDGDGAGELIVSARFAKPNLTAFNGRGWGAAYLVYGDSNRMAGVKALNSVGDAVPGVRFRGIRTPLDARFNNWTQGLSDITVVDDMDGDDLPEFIFSFPRVESITLNAPAWAGMMSVQHPDLLADIPNMGSMEYDAVDYMGGSFIPNYAQFTRGGIVIVSSHNQMLTNRGVLTRKFDRSLDLHEVGQMFNFMVPPSLGAYVRKVHEDPLDPFDPTTWEECSDCVTPNVWEPDTPCDPPGSGEPEGCCDPEDCGVDPACECTCTEGCGPCLGDPENEAETYTQRIAVAWDVWLGGG